MTGARMRYVASVDVFGQDGALNPGCYRPLGGTNLGRAPHRGSRCLVDACRQPQPAHRSLPGSGRGHGLRVGGLPLLCLVVVAVALLGACVLLALPGVAVAGDIQRVSLAGDGTQGNSSSHWPSISADGRHVAFYSSASNLVPGDTNGKTDVFVHDRTTGATQRVSVAGDGTQGISTSWFSSISADGRYVAFLSYASNLVPDDPNNLWNFFVHDRSTGATQRVSEAGDGTQGSPDSIRPFTSADGRYVAFVSYATDLVPGDTNGTGDVFVHDRSTGLTQRVSVAGDGTQGNADSVCPSVSADGRYVAFHSSASNLVPGDTNGTDDVFVHDRSTGATQRASMAGDGTQGNAISVRPSISADGRYVAFHSSASNLVPGDTTGTDDVFVHDRSTGLTQRVSVAGDGTQGNANSIWPSISADGRHVAFQSSASNLVPGDTTGTDDVFVHDRSTGLTQRVSVAGDGTQGNANSIWPSISADGRHVAFQSSASNLVPGDTNGTPDVFVVGLISLAPPTGLGAIDSSSLATPAVELTWTASTSPGVTGYNIYRSTSPASSFLSDVGNVTTYRDEAVVSGTTYYYYVEAYDAEGDVSLPSNVISLTATNGPSPFYTHLYRAAVDAEVDLWKNLSPFLAGSFEHSVGRTATGDWLVSRGDEVSLGLKAETGVAAEPLDAGASVAGFGYRKTDWRYGSSLTSSQAAGTLFNLLDRGGRVEAADPDPYTFDAADLARYVLGGPDAPTNFLLASLWGHITDLGEGKQTDAAGAGLRVAAHASLGPNVRIVRFGKKAGVGLSLADLEGELESSFSQVEHLDTDETGTLLRARGSIDLDLLSPKIFGATAKDKTQTLTLLTTLLDDILPETHIMTGADVEVLYAASDPTQISRVLLRFYSDEHSYSEYELTDSATLNKLQGLGVLQALKYTSSSPVVTLNLSTVIGGAAALLQEGGDPATIAYRHYQSLDRGTVDLKVELAKVGMWLDLALDLEDSVVYRDQSGILGTDRLHPHITASYSAPNITDQLLADLCGQFWDALGPDWLRGSRPVEGNVLVSWEDLHLEGVLDGPVTFEFTKVPTDGLYLASGGSLQAAALESSAASVLSLALASPVYDIGPDLDGFSLALTLTYQDDLPGEHTPEELEFLAYDPDLDRWTALPAVLDTTAQTLTATITRTGTFCLAVDDHAPNLSILSPSEGGSVSNATPAIEVVATDAGLGLSTVGLTLDGESLALAEDATVPGLYSAIVPSALSEGSHTLVLTATDAAGNESQAEAIFAVDVTTPEVPTDLACVIENRQPCLTWTAVAGATGYVIERAVAEYPFVSLLATDTSTEVSDPLADMGYPYAYQVRAIDVAGNQSEPSLVVSVALPLYRDVAAGWQLVAGSSGSDTEGNAVFSYLGGAYQSTKAAALEAGRGYWVKYTAAGTAALTVVPAPFTTHLTKGWNLIGNPTPVQLSLPGGLTAFVYDGGGYRSTSTLEPGEGAWVKVTEEQDIVLVPGE